MVTERFTDLDRYQGIELTRVIRAWDDLERRNGTGVEIADFSLGNPEWCYRVNPFKSREDVANRLQVIAGDIDRGSIDGEYLGAKADSLQVYAQILDKPGSMSFEVAMERIAGHFPRPISRHYIERQRSSVAAQFNTANGRDFNRSGWTTFYEERGISPNMAAEQIREAERETLFQVVSEIGVRSYPRTEIDVVSEEEYWVGWVKADREKAYLRLNSHNVNRMRFYPGVPIRMLMHELGGHAVQAKSFADNMREGVINPGLGDTTVPGVEQWLLEGWASTITRIRPSVLAHLSPEVRRDVELSVEIAYLTDIAYTTAQAEFFGSGRPMAVIVNDLQDLLPHEPLERIELVMKGLTERPHRMFYLPVYGDASYTLREDVESLPENAKQMFIDKIYKRPLTPAQVKRYITTLAA